MGGFFRTWSVDIVAAGLAGAAFGARACGVSMPPAWWFSLATAIWVTYAADHLLDARRVGARAANPRHAGHARHRRPVSLILLLAGGAGAAAALIWLPGRVLVAGGLVGALAIVHLMAAQTLKGGRYPKEALVAIIYVAGLWAGPIALAPRIPAAAIAALMLHACVAYQYLVLYALFERELDRADGSPSLVLASGRGAAVWHLHVTTLVIVTGSIAAAARMPAAAPMFVALGLAALAPAVAWRRRGWFEQGERHRLIEYALLVLALPALGR